MGDTYITTPAATVVVARADAPQVIVSGPSANGATVIVNAGTMATRATALSATAERPISGHRALTLTASGQVRHADCTDPADAQVLGISQNAALAGEDVTLSLGGLLSHSGWNYTPGQPLYLGLDGALVQTVPPGAAFSKALGTALSATRIQIDLQPAIYL